MVEMINTALMRTAMAAGRLRQRLTEERGQDLLEYAMLSGFVAAALAGAFIFADLGGALESMATSIAACVDFNDLTVCP